MNDGCEVEISDTLTCLYRLHLFFITYVFCGLQTGKSETAGHFLQ